MDARSTSPPTHGLQLGPLELSTSLTSGVIWLRSLCDLSVICDHLQVGRYSLQLEAVGGGDGGPSPSPSAVGASQEVTVADPRPPTADLTVTAPKWVSGSVTLLRPSLCITVPTLYSLLFVRYHLCLLGNCNGEVVQGLPLLCW